MYFPIGWPKVLDGRKATSGRPVKIFRHRTRDLVVEVRSSSVAFWHSRLCILLSSYVRSSQCVEENGLNTTAALKVDGSTLVIATSKCKLLFLRLQYSTVSNVLEALPPRNSHWIRNHGMFFQSPLEGGGAGREVEVVQVDYIRETSVMGNVLDVLSMGNQVLVATGYGVLHRLSWEGSFYSGMAIDIHKVPFANDAHPETRGQTLPQNSALHTRQVCYSPALHGFAAVLSDGRGAFLTCSSLRYDPGTVRGLWMRGLADAVCVGINSKYRLLAFGKTNGSVEVYGGDESSGEWNLSHTLQFTRRQFPDTGMQLGEVSCVEWSVPDGMCVAVSWKNGGLSLWSVFGSLLLCSLGDQPGTPSPLNPHYTILETLCWSSDGYHLWMLPMPSGEKAGHVPHTPGDQRPSGEGGRQHVLVMEFMRNSIVSNPVVANHRHLFLQGSDRLYLNTSHSFPRRGNTAVEGGASSRATPNHSNNIGTVSSPQWKVISLPATYMVLNWPIQYAAVSDNGCNLGVAGRAGFALYSTTRRKWKLFGNEVQEQGLVCRGGMAWFREVIIFPCRVMDKREEVRFYSLHSNLDNSQLLSSLKITSPIIKLNLHGNFLFLASHDCHVTIVKLNLQIQPKGLVLSASKVHELNLSKYMSSWAATLISMVPSNIRAEPECMVKNVGVSEEEESQVTHHRAVDSILFSIGGKLFMVQQEMSIGEQLASLQLNKEPEEVWSFGDPVCLAGSVEAVWTPPPLATLFSLSGGGARGSGACISRHVSESLWMSCGGAGMKVWLPLFPRDEGHMSFLSKRIMLTLPSPAYPQVVMFADAVLFGLSHETAFSEQLLATRDTFPFSTIERTTNIFLHHILRKLLRRNLGGHALHIARSYSHLPYFSHVLELMLHEILEEEAPGGTMPIPDALLPRVVEYIKQFPEFLETVGHCARKTEVALWQYLFAAVGNPRDLFEWCIVDGRLQTAATYLIIIQNLEAPAVSRQLATRLLDAALESSNWSLCKDLVRFLKAIGPGEAVESPPSTTTPLSSHKSYTPLTASVFSTTPSAATPTAGIVGGGNGPTSSAPDLDRSIVQKARDHLTSGSTSGSINLSVDYMDASGKMIRRPQFVLDMDSREDYFMELILSRHARKLLMSHSVRDLGRFSAHLDFPLQTWLVRERERAAHIDDFPHSLRQLHVEFQWPYPRSYSRSSLSLEEEEDVGEDQRLAFSPKSDNTTRTGSTLADGTDALTESTTIANSEASVQTDSALSSSSKFRRGHRPPNLNLSPPKSGVGLEQLNVMLKPSRPGDHASQLEPGEADGEQALSSTPTKHSANSGSVSEKVSLVMKQNHSSSELNAEMSSIGEEGSDWDLNSEVAMVTGVGGSSRGSPQAEKEIRYLLEVMLRAGCLDWSVVLALLLLDASLLAQALDSYSSEVDHGLELGVVRHTLKGVEQLQTWAESECPGYMVLLHQVQVLVNQLCDLLSAQQSHSQASAAQKIEPPITTTPSVQPEVAESLDGRNSSHTRLSNRYSSGSDSLGSEQDGSSGCVLS